MMDGAFENSVMIRAGHGYDAVLRSLRGSGLQELLQFTFRVFQYRNDVEASEGIVKLAKNKVLCRLEPAIEKNGAEQRFKGVGQRRTSIPSAVQFFPSAEDEMLAYAQLARALRQRTAIHQFGPALRKRAFTKIWKFFVQLARQDKLQYRIAEKLKTLIGFESDTLFVRH